MEFLVGSILGAAVLFGAQVAFPKVSDILGNIHRSRALNNAKALIAQAEANAQALAAAKALVASQPKPPTPPANPLATGPSGATGA